MTGVSEYEGASLNSERWVVVVFVAFEMLLSTVDLFGG